MNVCTHCTTVFTSRQSFLRHIRAPPDACVIHRQHHTCSTCGVLCASITELLVHTLQTCNPRADDLQSQLELCQQRANQADELAATHWQALSRERDNHERTIKHHKSLMDTVQYNESRMRADFERQISKLESINAELRMVPRTQVTHATHITGTNVQVNNFVGALNLDPQHIERVVDTTFNREALIGGTESLARYTIDQFLTDEDGNALYVASDTARHVFKYRDATTGQMLRDPKAAMLLRSLMPPVYRQVRALCPLGDIAWYDAEKRRDDMGLRVLEASYDQVIAVSASNPNEFCKALVRVMSTQRMLPAPADPRMRSVGVEIDDEKE